MRHPLTLKRLSEPPRIHTRIPASDRPISSTSDHDIGLVGTHTLPLEVLGPSSRSLESSAERKRRSHDGAAAGRTGQLKLTTKSLDAVGEPAQP
jgi:hypothetical protein